MASPFRADQVGSLLRPPEVLAARKALDESRISRAEFNAVADKAILQALELQREVGLDVYTDGEYRRSWWAGAWADALDGLIADAQPLASPFRGPGWQGPGAESARAVLAEVFKPAVVGAKLRLARRLNGDEAAFLRQHAPGPWKITMAGVASRGAAQFRPGLTEPFYATPDDLNRELAGFMRQEMEALIDEGCSYIQVDSLRYTSWMGPRLQQMIESGVDYMKDLEDQIALDNLSTAGVRGRVGVTVGLHICRGNNRSSWATEGSYDPVAEKLFTQLNVDRFLLEYDDERSGGFEPLRFVPRDKMVVLGLISSKVPQPESREVLLRRIEEAAKHVPIENLAISPQCGFASTAPGNLLTWDEQRRKLELVAAVAREVWG